MSVIVPTFDLPFLSVGPLHYTIIKTQLVAIWRSPLLLISLSVLFHFLLICLVRSALTLEDSDSTYFFPFPVATACSRDTPRGLCGEYLYFSLSLSQAGGRGGMGLAGAQLHVWTRYQFQQCIGSVEAGWIVGLSLSASFVVYACLMLYWVSLSSVWSVWWLVVTQYSCNILWLAAWTHSSYQSRVEE
jgi:hypothetical protein